MEKECWRQHLAQDKEGGSHLRQEPLERELVFAGGSPPPTGAVAKGGGKTESALFLCRSDPCAHRVVRHVFLPNSAVKEALHMK